MDKKYNESLESLMAYGERELIEYILELQGVIYKYTDDDICPECGSTDVRSNSSDELQCDNCGYSETE
jgi:transposase